MGTGEISYYAILLRDGYGVSGEEWGEVRGERRGMGMGIWMGIGDGCGWTGEG